MKAATYFLLLSWMKSDYCLRYALLTQLHPFLYSFSLLSNFCLLGWSDWKVGEDKIGYHHHHYCCCCCFGVTRNARSLFSRAATGYARSLFSRAAAATALALPGLVIIAWGESTWEALLLISDESEALSMCWSKVCLISDL